MNKIENLKDLRLEIKRLEAKKAQEEFLINQDVKQIQESLRPANLLVNTFNTLFSHEKTAGSLVKGGVNIGLDLLINKVLFRKSSFITKTILTFLAHKVTANAVDNHPEEIMSKLKSVFASLKDRFMPGKVTPEREVYNNEY